MYKQCRTHRLNSCLQFNVPAQAFAVKYGSVESIAECTVAEGVGCYVLKNGVIDYEGVESDSKSSSYENGDHYDAEVVGMAGRWRLAECGGEYYGKDENGEYAGRNVYTACEKNCVSVSVENTDRSKGADGDGSLRLRKPGDASYDQGKLVDLQILCY